MRDDDEVPLEDMIAIEQVAEELWREATKGSDMEWQALSVLAKQAWRNCAHGGHHLAQKSRSAVGRFHRPTN